MAIDSQQPRFLAQRSEQGYVSDLHLALRDEPEAVSEVEQREITRRAARLAELRRAEAWVVVRVTLVAAADDVELIARGARSGPVASALRDLRRDIARVDKVLGVR